MNAEEDRKERRTAWALLIVAPVLLLIICAFVVAGLAPGLEAGHPKEYLEATCISWLIVSLVIPALRLARLVSLPSLLVFVIYANIFFYVLSLNLGLYLNVSWFGDFGHVVSSTIVTTIVFVALCLVETHSPAHVTFGSRAGMCAMLFLVAMSFGGIWEMMEGFVDGVTGNDYMVYGARDTMGDLTADMVGAFIVTALVYWYLGRHTPEELASKVRFGRKAFVVEDE